MLQKWENLWYLLLNYCNWEEVSGSLVHQPSMATLGKAAVPGIHTFKSKELLMAYIQRFPFLVQGDQVFGEFLELHHWKYRLNGNRKEFDFNGLADPK